MRATRPSLAPVPVPRARADAGRRPPVAVYVHVPFCVSVCPYCDFVVYGGRAARGPDARLGAYLDAVTAELGLRASALDALGPHPPLASAYLGGGTPSLLPAADVAGLLEAAACRYGLVPGAEVTLEANPGPDELGDLAGFAAAGVTRLSLGAQSLDPAELRRLGRRHRPDDVLAAIRAARGAGIRSVSVDLLYDVPGQTLDTWRDTLTRVLDAGVDHVSAYALTLDDPDTEGLTGPLGDHLPTRPGARAWRDRARAGQDEDRAADQYALADELLGSAGLRWYELSNWARPGHESRHNLAYWRQEAYDAAGPGAHAFDGRTRRWNAARLDGYLAALRPGAVRDAASAGQGAREPVLPPGGEERLDDATLERERAILALRLAEGLDPAAASGPDVAPAIAWGRRHGLVEDVEGDHRATGDPADRSIRVRLTLRGRLLANEVLSRIAGPE